VGGLLSVSDYIKAGREENADLVIIGDKAFNHYGMDLFGRHYSVIEKEIRKPLMVVRAEEEWDKLISNYGENE